MSSSNRPAVILLAVVTAIVAVGLWYLVGRSRVPAPGSNEYEAVTAAFYRGLAGLEVGLLDAAIDDFARATEIVPDEPASWANLALTHLRLGNFDQAAPAVARAAELAPGDSRIAFLQSRLETSRGAFDVGLAHLRRATTLDPTNLPMRMAVVEEVERSGLDGADEEAQRLLEEVVVVDPDNLFLLVERARLAARRGDAALFRETIDRLAPFAAGWPADVAGQFALVEQAATDPLGQDVAIEVAFLRNVLMVVPAFLDARRQVTTSVELIADPLVDFVRLEPARNAPDAPDVDLTYVADIVSGPAVRFDAVWPVSLDGIALPVLLGTDGREIRHVNGTVPPLPFPAGADGQASVNAHSLVAVDWNHDFRLDIAAVGPAGIFLFVQSDDGTFVDRTSEASSGSGQIGAADRIWAADIEMDGDMDLIVGRPAQAPAVLRNNGNGMWTVGEAFAGVVGLRSFTWGDIDEDGDPDAALLDETGGLHVFANQQAGAFARMEGPAAGSPVGALALADLDSDGRLDLVTADAAGSIRSSSWQIDAWVSREWVTDDALAGGGDVRLFVEDLDNNGAPDLVTSGGVGSASRIWLADQDGGLVVLDAAVDARIGGVVDLDGDGALDLAGLADGRPVRLTAVATRGYHHQVVRPRALAAAGDQRVNTFGIGGVVEVRSGRLVQEHVVTGPVVHVGIGARTSVDVTRIVWPNGVPQAEFDSQVDAAITAEQRLKGSCPWVFADNGSGPQFVTDFLWRSPLGLRINAAETAGVTQTEDWIRIASDQLVARDGLYDIRITAELWETHYIDHVSLLAVDHPADVEVFVDERFVPGAAPALRVHALEGIETVADARDHRGQIVTPLVSARDGQYLDTFQRGPYQGIAEEHWVAFDVPARPADADRWWIVAHGWVYPTDSSINVAIGQGGRVRPQGLALDALDADGRWVTVASDLGFPAGKNKTVLIDLAPLEAAGLGDARRVRLRTNLEIYWDSIATAESAGDDTWRTERIAASAADLRYRGYSVTSGSRDEPETPAYERIANTRPRWRDLAGHYTRFGDVRELLAEVEDRYVIMNAGDELRLSFPAATEPPEGWTRDFVLVGDGWNKDGDFNTSHSRTVLPLPAHGAPYTTSSATATLMSDPVYQRYPDDWRHFHTRYVAPRAFVEGLRMYGAAAR